MTLVEYKKALLKYAPLESFAFACRFLCIFVLAGECIEEWNGAAGLGRKCKYRNVPRQTNFQKEWRGTKSMCLPTLPPRANPRHF
ncbi:hypothetical protein A2118_03020 [Candidatus Kaiserbacteria bacterium GWA2_50_9]|uniref:Uncharacterized protein n=1 Tax=Candidatus Kaiserbacteria bacterium GWA2_50_9 TaxID=1798474 RepID=A0A1F6BWK0_9BACT|nr:MAG: hypothetical protein A2118_03020 [Candidatus Kaiserbacteria bacterium GWA2_50_9]